MAGPITSLQANVSVTFPFTAPNNSATLGPGTINSTVFTISQQFGSLAQSQYGANQCKLYSGTIALSANTTVDCVAASVNILGNAAATLARVFAAFFWIPSVAQSAALGSLSTSVTVGNAAANAIALFGLTATSISTLNNGEYLMWSTPAGGTAGTSGGTPVGSGTKNFFILNNDSTNAAKYYLLLAGNDA